MPKGAKPGNTNSVGNKGGKGGPSKWKPENVSRAREMAAAAFTEQEMADAFGVATRTLRQWRLEHPELAIATKIAKDAADDRVEFSLYHRAMGYEHDDVDLRVVGGRVEKTKVRRYYPPDTGAATMWLKNRRGDVWRDKSEIRGPGPNGEHYLAPALTVSIVKKDDGSS